MWHTKFIQWNYLKKLRIFRLARRFVPKLMMVIDFVFLGVDLVGAEEVKNNRLNFFFLC